MRLPGRRRIHTEHREGVPVLPSIYEHIWKSLGSDGRLAEKGLKLPDEEYQKGRYGGGIGFAPGAVDGILRHAPLDRDEIDREIGKLHEAVLEFASKPTSSSEERLLQLLVSGYASGSVPLLLKRLSERSNRKPERMYLNMRRLLLQSGHREVVKFAIAITATFRRPQDLDLFRVLAHHPEFTKYAGEAIARMASDPVSDLMTLATTAEGWGKVNLVERLLESDRTEVRDYLLRDGLKHVSHLEGYLALPIATRYKLHEELDTPTVELGLLQGAADILQVLTYEAVDGGPDGTILDYPQGGDAVERFLAKFESIASSPRDFIVVWSIRQFVSSNKFEKSRLEEAGWDSRRRAKVREGCDRILSRPEWIEQTNLALKSNDPTEVWQGLTMARTLGIPLHDYFVTRLRKNPLDSSMWFQFVGGGDEQRMDEALQLAREILDYETIATGPANESLVSVGHDRHSCVNYLLQELRRFPGKGWEVIRASLRSPAKQNRTFALFALKMWKPSDLTEEVVQAVMDSLHDPSDHVRAAANKVVDTFRLSSREQG